MVTGTAGDYGTDNNFGAGGNGGGASLTIERNLTILKDSDFNIRVGASVTPSVADGGDLTFTVANKLEIAKSQAVRMAIQGAARVDGDDQIAFETLLFNPSSSFTTTASVYSYNNPNTPAYYQVKDLDVITRGTWSTRGAFAPDNVNGTNNDFVRFDMTDNTPDDLILTFAGSSGEVNLSSFNPVAQQNAYLSDGDWSKKSDVPSFGAYRSDDISPAFITSLYQTKRLDLGAITLVDKTTGALEPQISELRGDGNLHYISSGNNAHGDSLYDDFAYTASLRRYYWDVYVDAQDPNLALKAHNYHTADATKIYTQSVGAAIASNVQTFLNTIDGINDVDLNAPYDKFMVATFLGGSHIRTKTGSHVDVDNFSATLLVAKKIQTSFGDASFGAFGEYGNGSYDTYSFVPR
jgi:hypothetical protein